mgnify:CR=1 FL=1
MDQQPSVEALTPREREVLLLVDQGYQTSEIAQRLSRSTRTIDNQILSARQKLGGVTRRQAARMVAQHSGEQSLPKQLTPINHDVGEALLPEAPHEVRDHRASLNPEPERSDKATEGVINELNTLPRVVLIAILSILIILTLLLVFIFSDGLQRWGEALIKMQGR